MAKQNEDLEDEDDDLFLDEDDDELDDDASLDDDIEDADLDDEDEPSDEELDDDDALDDEKEDEPSDEKEKVKPNSAIAKMRKQLNDLTKQNRAFQEEKNRLEAQRIQAELNAAPLTPPTFESCGYDPDKFQEETVKYAKAQGQREQIVAKQQNERQKADNLWREAQDRYKVGKTTVKEKDYDDVESIVEATLSGEQLRWLLASTKVPVKVIYAAGKNAKALAMLKKAQTPFEFANAIGKIEVLRGGTPMKAPPKPEKRPPSSSGSSGSSTSSRVLNDALKKVENGTMTMTKYRELKQKHSKKA